MRPVLSADAISALDRRAEELGVSRSLLMESAGRGAAEEIRRGLLLPPARRQRVVALCGPGGNGGDALCALRWLGLWGADPWAVVLGEPRGAAAEQFRAFLASFPERVVRVGDEGELSGVEEEVLGADLVVDGILGVGSKGKARGLLGAAIELLGRTRAQVVAIDLPSGLAVDSGAIPGPAVRAGLTLAMGALKPCHLLPPAAQRCGVVRLVEVAYPPGAWEGVEPLGQVLTADFCAAALPPRPPFGHKGTFGRVLVVGGAVGMSGAVALAAEAALRAGAGLVHVLCPAPVHGVVASRVTEALVHPASADGGMFSRDAAKEAAAWASGMDVVVVGPGLGRGEGPTAVVRALWDQPKVVADADALFALAQEPGLLSQRQGDLVLTPHPGEFARLVGKTSDEVVADKIFWARKSAQEWKAVVVLKGPPTAIASPNGEVYLNTTGNTALAHGGAGDVLAGLIGGLWASGATPLEAACTGVYVHGKAAELLTRRAAARAMLPGDLLSILPRIFAALERLPP